MQIKHDFQDSSRNVIGHAEKWNLPFRASGLGSRDYVLGLSFSNQRAQQLG